MNFIVKGTAKVNFLVSGKDSPKLPLISTHLRSSALQTSLKSTFWLSVFFRDMLKLSIMVSSLMGQARDNHTKEFSKFFTAAWLSSTPSTVSPCKEDFDLIEIDGCDPVPSDS